MYTAEEQKKYSKEGGDMPRKKKTTEQREREASEKLVSEENVISLSKLTKEELERIINKLYDDVIGHATYIEEKNGYTTIVPGRELKDFTPEEHIAIYYYEHHKGSSGKDYAEAIVQYAVRPMLQNLAGRMLWDRGTSKYIETRELSTGEKIKYAKPDIIDELVQNASLDFLENLRYKYNPFNEKGYSKLTTYNNYNFQYSMIKALGEDDQTSYKDNEALGNLKRIDEYFREKGLSNPSSTDYVWAAEVLGINGITDTLVERLKRKKHAVEDSIDDLPIPDTQDVESIAIKNERDRMVNIILDQIGEYDKFAKWALLAFMEYTPPPKIVKRSRYEGSEIKGRMKYIKEYFVEHYYPKEKYGPITINTYTRLLEIAKEEFAYRSKLMGFFQRDTLEGDVYGLSLDNNEYIKDYISNIEQNIEEYNDDDKEYTFDRKYDPRYN